uniref:Glutathione-S-transferase n=1 Tax=Epiphyas postvittana TaxID=65032 RepID=A0A0K8TUZ9_EPIPO
MVLTLYTMDASPPVRAVNMTIELLGLTDVERIEVKLMELDQLKESYVKINPQHSVPTLRDDDFVVWDSHAIVTYLITVYGADDSLYPSDPKQRALIDQRLHFDSGILFPVFREVTDAIVFEGAKTFTPKTLANVNKAYDFMEKFLATPWLVGEDMTVADVCCVASISSIKELVAIDEDLYPRLTAWLKRCSKKEFYKKGNEPGLTQYRAIITSKLY